VGRVPNRGGYWCKSIDVLIVTNVRVHAEQTTIAVPPAIVPTVDVILKLRRSYGGGKVKR
jgi:hypothetical protein